MNRKLSMKDFIYKKIAVTFDSFEQEKEFLKLCAANGLKWANTLRADEYASSKYGFAEDGESITYCDALTHCHRAYYKSNGYTLVPASAFFADDESKENPVTKYKVIIECVDGKTTTAWLFADGKEVKYKMCRCHYTDKFRLSTGVKIAVERLFAKKELYWKEWK